MGLHAQFALANRRAIADEIERLIALLDIVDGDCDLEDDDPAGGNILDVPHDVNPDDMLPVLPRYGVDQSAGPVNEREGERAWHKRMMAL